PRPAQPLRHRHARCRPGLHLRVGAGPEHACLLPAALLRRRLLPPRGDVGAAAHAGRPPAERRRRCRAVGRDARDRLGGARPAGDGGVRGRVHVPRRPDLPLGVSGVATGSGAPRWETGALYLTNYGPYVTLGVGSLLAVLDGGPRDPGLAALLVALTAGWVYVLHTRSAVNRGRPSAYVYFFGFLALCALLILQHPLFF